MAGSASNNQVSVFAFSFVILRFEWWLNHFLILWSTECLQVYGDYNSPQLRILSSLVIFTFSRHWQNMQFIYKSSWGRLVAVFLCSSWHKNVLIIEFCKLFSIIICRKNLKYLFLILCIRFLFISILIKRFSLVFSNMLSNFGVTYYCFC